MAVFIQKKREPSKNVKEKAKKNLDRALNDVVERADSQLRRHVEVALRVDASGRASRERRQGHQHDLRDDLHGEEALFTTVAQAAFLHSLSGAFWIRG